MCAYFLHTTLKINRSIYYFYPGKYYFMIRNMLSRLFFVCLLALPCSVFAQLYNDNRLPNNLQPVNRYELLDKTWHFIAMKCPDKIGTEAHHIHYFSTLKLTVSNSNNINYGTYHKKYNDVRDNPDEKGTYSLTTDEVGNVVLTLKRNKTGATAKYMVSFVETNHLTLIRTDEGEKCNITYAIAP